MSEANTTEVNTAAVNPEQPRYTKKQVGLMIFAIFTCMILTGLSGYKLLPMQTAIMDYFHIAESSYGILNTAASWVSICCAIPSLVKIILIQSNICRSGSADR